PAEPYPHDPQKAKQLLAEAGYPNGIDAGLFHAIPGFPTAAEVVVNDLNAAGIRIKLAPMERAAFYADWKAHKFHGLFMTGAGNAGNAASRVEEFMYSKGSYADGGNPISMRCSSSRRASATARSAKRSSTRSSN